jgi:hypothetical protein
LLKSILNSFPITATFGIVISLWSDFLDGTSFLDSDFLITGVTTSVLSWTSVSGISCEVIPEDLITDYLP